MIELIDFFELFCHLEEISLTSGSKKHFRSSKMPSVRLELTTFRLWDWRANQLRQEGFWTFFQSWPSHLKFKFPISFLVQALHQAISQWFRSVSKWIWPLVWWIDSLMYTQIFPKNNLLTIASNRVKTIIYEWISSEYLYINFII